MKRWKNILNVQGPDWFPPTGEKKNDKILDELEQAGLIEKLDVSEGYLSPSFCVPKPLDILTPHLVIDYLTINDMVGRPGQVTPSCDEVIQKMGEGNKYFLSLVFFPVGTSKFQSVQRQGE